MIRTIKIIQAPRLAKLFEKCYLDIGWCRALLTTLSYWASLYTDLFTSGAIFSIIVQNLVPKLFTPSCQFFQTDIYQWHFAPRPPQPQHTYYDENRAIGCQLNRKGVNNWQVKIVNWTEKVLTSDSFMNVSSTPRHSIVSGSDGR